MTIFRYPGGKSKYLKFLRPYLERLSKVSEHFHDCFVGGGSVVLDFAKNYPRHTIHINDLDEWIYSFWLIVSGNRASSDFYRLLEMVSEKPTVELFERYRETPPATFVDKAYYALFFNRTTFSGIRSAHPIGGFGQKSKWTVACRYNPQRLSDEIFEAHTLLRHRTIVTNCDISNYLNGFTELDKHSFYLDPPYLDKGSQLYECSMTKKQHRLLAMALKSVPNWVLSHGNSDYIKRIYKYANIGVMDARYSINGAKISWADAKEMVIFSDSILGKS